MSIQLMIAAAYLPHDEVNQGQKLALMKLCDSADDETRLARPGLARLAAWVGVTAKRAITIITELVRKGLVERVHTGKAGRAAVYRIFPKSVPRTPTTPELKERLAAREAAPKNPRKARTDVRRAAPATPAMTQADLEERETARRREVENCQEGAGFHAGNPAEADCRVSSVEPSGFHTGNPEGFTDGTPSFPVPSFSLPFPPTPAADAAGEPAAASPLKPSGAPNDGAGCTRHRGKPAASCRGCGTNPRAERARETATRKAEEHEEHGQFWQAWHAEREERRQQVQQRSEATAEAARRTREGIRKPKR
ncbi:helix-turn-helix domain-containing protein [Streptomyces sp. NBC_00390]|uniref:helix-turn-helix domain-containing protein n=1 Tax=Streptomyces sp. NBC_00390 TaxID=2975736 RepID=UPI002E24F991